jgi:hypothetical protein
MPISIPVGGVDLANATTRPSLYTGGATLSGGTCVYADASDSDANGVGKLKATNVTTEAGAECVGVLLQDTADDEGGVVMGTGCVLKNPTFTKGTWYVADNSGAISVYGDLTSSTDYVTWLGYCDEDGYLSLNIIATGTIKS